MNKTKLLLIAVFAAVLSVACVMFAACGTKYEVTWDVPETATVAVDGYSELPKSVGENTGLVFKVTPANGYGNPVVKVEGTAAALKADADGKYKVTVTKATKITVTVEELISTVTVTTNPTNMTYFAGETLNTAGMVVTVKYATDRTTTITEGFSVNYPTGGAFSIGDTTFAVTYAGVKSANVTIPAVKGKITLKTDSAVVASTLIGEWEANSELTVTKDGTDIIITYDALSADLTLPTAEQIMKGEEGDYIFRGWSVGDQTATKISKDETSSVTATASFDPVLLVLNSIKYEAKTVGTETVPYLVIKGKFQLAKTAYLFLYEGNDKVELKGDTVTGTNRGDEFTLEFDLRKLVEKEYKGKWMDIKFVAENGEDKQTQEIKLADYEGVEGFVDTTQTLECGDYLYSFATYEGTLKALYSDAPVTKFTVSAGTDAQGNPTVTFAGKVREVEKYKGKTVDIDFWISTSIHKFGVIDNDGKWSVTFNLNEKTDADEVIFKLNTSGYAHFKIIESETEQTELYKDGKDGNLVNNWCLNEDLTNVNVDLIENAGALVVATEEANYYFGKGKWGGFVFYAKSLQEVNVTKVGLEVKDGKPMAIFSGTSKNVTRADLEKFVIDGEVSGRVKLTLTIESFDEATGAFVLVADVSVLASGRNYMHAGFEAEPGNLSESAAAIDEAKSSITVGGKKYSLGAEWGTRQIVVEDAPDAE